MVKIAFLFPGQGAQYVGMGRDFYDNHPKGKELFDIADEVLNEKISKICFEGPEETLRLTQNTQPALLIHSIIALKTLEEHDIDSVMVAGHSLGEFSALVAAGSLKFQDAVHLVRQRGKFMQEAVPVGVGGMAALIGLTHQKVREVCDQVSIEGHLVQPANLNSPEQIVIAGHREAVLQAVEIAKESGAKKAVILPVSAPFHSSLMKPAEVKLKVELDKVEFQDPEIPVICNVTAKALTKGDDARDALREQVCAPVLWADTMQYLVESKIDVVIELGSGRVLSGLMRRYDKSIACYQVEDLKSLNKTIAAIKK